MKDSLNGWMGVDGGTAWGMVMHTSPGQVVARRKDSLGYRRT